MSDSTGHRRDETAPPEKPWKKDTKNVPPLVWLVIVALVAIIAVAVLYSRKTVESPSGGTMPAATADIDTVPPQPATTDAAGAGAASDAPPGG